jgi:hypothetical protein
MKVDWVTVFALRGDAYMWWSSWKQGNQNVTWETFERAFIKKFIPDLWEMLEAAEGEEQENHESVEKEEESMEVRNKTDSGLTQNSSEQLDQKFPATTTVIPSVEFTEQQNSECHKESVNDSYGLFETEVLEKMKIKRVGGSKPPQGGRHFTNKRGSRDCSRPRTTAGATGRL